MGEYDSWLWKGSSFKKYSKRNILKKLLVKTKWQTERIGPNVLKMEPLHNNTTATRKRIFVSMMNEFKYVRGTLSKLRKRDLAKVILKSPGAIVSKSVRDSCYNVFINEINDGGLPM